MDKKNFEFADLSASSIEKIKQAEKEIKQNQTEEVILLAYEKQ